MTRKRPEFSKSSRTTALNWADKCPNVSEEVETGKATGIGSFLAPLTSIFKRAYPVKLHKKEQQNKKTAQIRLRTPYLYIGPYFQKKSKEFYTRGKNPPFIT